jgi:antitoxin component HigA of HigAB toxin-antitoxin module
MLKLLKTEEDYQKAIDTINDLINCEENSKEEQELETMSQLVWDFEEKYCG